MPTVKLDSDEYYPYYYMVKYERDYYEAEVELTEYEVAFIEDAMYKFQRAQDIMRKAAEPNGRR